MASQSSRRWYYLERTLPWLVLLILVTFTFAHFALSPYAGFEFSYDEVLMIFPPAQADDSLKVGDHLLQVGDLSWDEYFAHRGLPVFAGINAGQRVPLRVERAGQVQTIDWVFTGATDAQIQYRFISMWWLAYFFWLAGTSALLFIRPRDSIWKLLVAFNYLAALWLVTGIGPSHWHTLGSALVLRSAVWLFVPVSWHLNWLFPRPLARLPAPVWWCFYGLAGGLALLEWFSLPPESAFEVGLILAAAGIVGLLLIHLILQPAYRRFIWPLVAGAAIALLPPLLVLIADLLGVRPSQSAWAGAAGLSPSNFIYLASLLGIAALPGIYFYSVAMLQTGWQNWRVRRLVRYYLFAVTIGAVLVFAFAVIFIRYGSNASTFWISIFLVTLATVISIAGLFPLLALPALQTSSADSPSPAHPELRANRLVSIYLFFTIFLAVTVPLVWLIDAWVEFPSEIMWLALGTAVMGIIATILWFDRFQRFVDRRVLGISLPPTQLLEIYSARITTSLEKPALVRLLRDQLLPSLLVRQSALFQVEPGQELLPLYTFGVHATELPTSGDLPELLRCAQASPLANHSDGIPCPYPWIRVLLPLRIEEQLAGFWLMGRRDPDDEYDHSEVEMLQSIANQTAIALINIQQSERLHALYQADIERQEAERADLALFLHDEVLNQLALLTMQIDSPEISSKIEPTYQQLVGNIRDAIQGLRPAMLNYGLYAALEGLVDELLERVGDEVTVRLEVPASEARYDPKVEQHLYRIVQQACENALRHARCREVWIAGRLEQRAVELEVWDDGVGLPAGLAMDLNQLLAAGHYGLAGMHERAALIGAELRIESTPQAGTRIVLKYSLNGNPGSI